MALAGTYDYHREDQPRVRSHLATATRWTVRPFCSILPIRSDDSLQTFCQVGCLCDRAPDTGLLNPPQMPYRRAVTKALHIHPQFAPIREGLDMSWPVGKGFSSVTYTIISTGSVPRKEGNPVSFMPSHQGSGNRLDAGICTTPIWRRWPSDRRPGCACRWFSDSGKPRNPSRSGGH